MVKQFFFILISLFLGYLLNIGLHIPIPANVLGFGILFFSLWVGIVKQPQVDKVSNFIIKYLAVFFVVPSVGVMQYLGLIGEQFFHIICPLFASIFFGFLTSAKVTEACISYGEKKTKKREELIR